MVFTMVLLVVSDVRAVYRLVWYAQKYKSCDPVGF